MYKNFFKPLFDFIIGLIAFPFVLLITIFVGIAIKLDDGGPILYNAPRLGKGGKPFKMFKFRSMKVNAPDIRLADGSTYNGEDDPRVTRIGRFLRKTSIDEIPQFINILIGDMSLIGPRPDFPSYMDNYTKEDLVLLTVKPGITGWNQVINRNSATGKEKTECDVYYAKNYSFVLDVRIFFKTIKTVILKENVYVNKDRM